MPNVTQRMARMATVLCKTLAVVLTLLLPLKFASDKGKNIEVPYLYP